MTSLARVHSSLFSAGTRPKLFSCRLGLRERARRGFGTRRCSNHTDTRPRAAGTGSRGGQLGSRRAGSVPAEEGGALSGTRPAGLRQLTRSSAAAQTSWHRTVETEGPVLTPRWIDGGARGSRRSPRREPAACPRGRGAPAAVRALPVSPSVRTAAAVADRCGSASSSC